MVGRSEIRKSIERATRTGQQDLFQGSSAHRISRLVPPGGAAAARSASPRSASPPSLSSRGTATLDTDAIAAAMAGTVQPETSSKKLPARNFGSGSSYRSTPSYSRSPRKRRGWTRLVYACGSTSSSPSSQSATSSSGIIVGPTASMRRKNTWHHVVSPMHCCPLI
eukprot:COSAG05_NODE_34_length_27784_cov_62.890129_16_plen_166_part_00